MTSQPLDLKSYRICVTGGHGFLGRHVIDALRRRAIADEQIIAPRRNEFDLTREADVERLYLHEAPDLVIHLAAQVGGIGANRRHPGRFFYQNISMGLHMIEHARRADIRKFVQVGTVCSYPKHCPTPFKESALWDGYPEETNAPYGVAKKALQVMLEGYRSEYGLRSAVVLPVNLYGPGDNFCEQSLARDSSPHPPLQGSLGEPCFERHVLGNGRCLARVSVRRRCGRRFGPRGRTD